MLSKLLDTQPALFISVVGSFVNLAIGAGIVSQAHGDIVMTGAGLIIPVVLQILSGLLIHNRVTPVK